MSCGYGAASLTEGLHAWPTSPQREGAAGVLICTTASDSEGTLGGLVALSEPVRLQGIVKNALRRAARCSSDPVCGMRTPSDPEDFLHGAACHCCSFASETSCDQSPNGGVLAAIRLSGDLVELFGQVCSEPSAFFDPGRAEVRGLLRIDSPVGLQGDSGETIDAP